MSLHDLAQKTRITASASLHSQIPDKGKLFQLNNVR